MYNVSKFNQYLIVAFIAFISTSALFVINFLLVKKHSYRDGLYKYTHECLYSCNSPITSFLTSTRGKNYYGMTDESDQTSSPEERAKIEKKDCLVSVWAFTHIFLYIIIGFYCPDLFFPTLLIGIFFEYAEKLYSNCHDALDVVFNSIGFGIGYKINKYVFKHNSLKIIPHTIYAFSTLIFAIGLIMFLKIRNHQFEHDEAKKATSY